MAEITVIGLGPAGPDLLTDASRRAIAEIDVAFLRTRRHPAAAVLPRAPSFDHLYETADDFTQVYDRIVERLVSEAIRSGHVLYAVPGSPAVAERTVEALREDARVTVEVIPALSFCDLAWTVLGVDPLASGVTLVDGRRFAVEAAGLAGPLLVGQCDQTHVLSEIKLSVEDGPDVTVLARLGAPDQSVFEVAWHELDRAFEPDHLTSLWIPRLAAPVAAESVAFSELVRTLRERCPWDRSQTHSSLRPYVLEEAAEVAAAIDGLGSDPSEEAVAALEAELGDLLFQVVIHSTLGAEQGWFDLATVTRSIHDKLERRHPHVFGDATAATPEEAVALWRAAKQDEQDERER